MSVGLIYSSTNGGTATTDFSLGSGPNGTILSEQTIYIRHTGANSITSVKFFIRPLTTTYSGASTPVNDHAEVLGWGDATTSLTFGGFQVNMCATTSFPVGSWPNFTTRQKTGAKTHRTGVGDNSTNAYTLIATSGAIADGTIQAGSASNVRFKSRIVVPSSVSATGIRQFEQAVLYNYTS